MLICTSTKRWTRIRKTTQPLILKKNDPIRSITKQIQPVQQERRVHPRIQETPSIVTYTRTHRTNDLQSQRMTVRVSLSMRQVLTSQKVNRVIPITMNPKHRTHRTRSKKDY